MARASPACFMMPAIAGSFGMTKAAVMAAMDEKPPHSSRASRRMSWLRFGEQRVAVIEQPKRDNPTLRFVQAREELGVELDMMIRNRERFAGRNTINRPYLAPGKIGDRGQLEAEAVERADPCC